MTFCTQKKKKFCKNKKKQVYNELTMALSRICILIYLYSKLHISSFIIYVDEINYHPKKKKLSITLYVKDETLI